MSDYLRFVLSRAGVPQPRLISYMPFREEWANRQIVSEFLAVYSDVSIAPLDRSFLVGAQTPNIIVIPHMHYFLYDGPQDCRLYRQLSRLAGSWVVLYGLAYRTIHILPAPQLYHFCRRWQTYDRIYRTAKRIRLLPFIEGVLRLWLVR